MDVLRIPWLCVNHELVQSCTLEYKPDKLQFPSYPWRNFLWSIHFVQNVAGLWSRELLSPLSRPEWSAPGANSFFFWTLKLQPAVL